MKIVELTDFHGETVLVGVEQIESVRAIKSREDKSISQIMMASGREILVQADLKDLSDRLNR